MRAKHLVASGVAALALVSRPGAPRADEAALALASRPFSLGEVSVARTVESALRVGRFDCESCNELSGRFTVVAWDVSVTLPVADHAAVFVLQPILFSGAGTVTGAAGRYPGALTAGVRHVGSAGPALALAAAVSVSLAYPAYEMGVTTRYAGAMIDDPSLYTEGLNTLRFELDVRRHWSALFAQAQLALDAHTFFSRLLGSSRAGLGAGVQLSGRAALLAELTAQLGGGQIYCDDCRDDPAWEGPSRLALSVGGRVALGPLGLGARGFLPLTDTFLPRRDNADTSDRDAAPSLSVTVDARF